MTETDNRSSENVDLYLVFLSESKNKNLVDKEIKSRLNSVKAFYHSVRNLLSSRPLSKEVKIKIYKTGILPIVLYGCETWFLTLKEVRPKVYENRVQRGIFCRNRGEIPGGRRKLNNEGLHNVYSSPNIIIIMKS
jgi:hypothetical protein